MITDDSTYKEKKIEVSISEKGEKNLNCEKDIGIYLLVINKNSELQKKTLKAYEAKQIRTQNQSQNQ